MEDEIGIGLKKRITIVFSQLFMWNTTYQHQLF